MIMGINEHQSNENRQSLFIQQGGQPPSPMLRVTQKAGRGIQKGEGFGCAPMVAGVGKTEAR